MLESWVLNRDSLEQLEKGKESRSSLLSSKNYGGLREQGAQGEQQKIQIINKDEEEFMNEILLLKKNCEIEFNT